MEDDFSLLILNKNLNAEKKWNPHIQVSEILPYFNFDISVFDVYENQLKQVSRDGIEYFEDFDSINELPCETFPCKTDLNIFNPNDIVTIPFIEYVIKSLKDRLKQEYLNCILLSTKDINQNDDNNDYLDFIVSNRIAIDYKTGYNKTLKNYLPFIELIIKETLEVADELPKNFTTIFEFIFFPFLLDGTVSLARLIELYVFYSINTIEVEKYCIEKLNELNGGKEIENGNQRLIWKGTPGEFGAIFDKLFVTGFIEVIKDKKNMVRLLHSLFEIKNEKDEKVSFDYLYKCFNDKKKDWPRNDFKIPNTDNYHNDK